MVGEGLEGSPGMWDFKKRDNAETTRNKVTRNERTRVVNLGKRTGEGVHNRLSGPKPTKKGRGKRSKDFRSLLAHCTEPAPDAALVSWLAKGRPG